MFRNHWKFQRSLPLRRLDKVIISAFWGCQRESRCHLLQQPLRSQWEELGVNPDRVGLQDIEFTIQTKAVDLPQLRLRLLQTGKHNQTREEGAVQTGEKQTRLQPILGLGVQTKVFGFNGIGRPSSQTEETQAEATEGSF